MAVKTYSKNSNTSLSRNFKVSEFACHGNGCCSTVMVDDKLVTYLQKIRDHFGKSITITSGYRCPIHNKNVNGATGSRHAKGQAADIVVQGVAPAEVAAYAESIGILGIGLYETSKDGHFVHIDTRDYKSFWYGQAQAARSTFKGYKTTSSVANNTSNYYSKKDFITDIQKAFGAPVDGVAGPVTLAKTKTLSAVINPRHAAVKAVQKYLLMLGYSEMGRADGWAGAKFTAAVSRFQKDTGCTPDGIIGTVTWKKLLGLK